MSLLSESYRKVDPEGELNYGFEQDEARYQNIETKNQRNQEVFGTKMKNKNFLQP